MPSDPTRSKNYSTLNTKVCPQCTIEKPHSDFGADKARKYGINPWCKKCTKDYLNERKDRYRDVKNQGSRKRHSQQRLQVLQHYSNNEFPFCACCGEDTIEFLSMDHIDGGGNKEKQIHKGNFYAWLIKTNFPKGYRVLCHNCNQARGAYGYCPHEVKQRTNASN